ncbi:MAG: SDR family NAD(P)-dependent oxidoreductase [Rhizomicrobium sp.]
MKSTEAKTYLITGAGSGIGAALATKLARTGQYVMLADINLAAAQEIVAAVGPHTDAVELDIRDERAWERAFDATFARFGRLDVLINNAGIVHTGLARNVAIGDHQATIDTNFIGPLTGMIGALHRFRDIGAGHLVTVCSMTAFMPLCGLASYSASKHALRAFHYAVALEERHSFIDFTIVHPTATDTPMLDKEAADDDAAMAFLAKSVSADEVADTVIKAIKSKAIEVCMPQASARKVKSLGADPKRLRSYADQMERIGRDGQTAKRAAALRT